MTRETRTSELARNLAAVRERIAVACAHAGRDADAVTLIGITKTWPADDVRILSEVGLRDIGENRDQEARAKHVECADLPVRWHFVGQLQRNKCRSVASYADVVHSVDRPELVDALSRGAQAANRTVIALVQVSLDDEAHARRGGAAPDEALPLADAVDSAGGLRLGGVMAVAPLRAAADVAFARLARLAAAIRERHPEAIVVSAGMSDDLEAAIRHGATHVRVGTALLGHRASTLG